MFKMIIIATQTFETVEAANAFYEEIKGELRNHPAVHVNGRMVTSMTGYSPENPEGHEVPA